MSDIFKEIEEDIRHERLKKLWDKFGIYVIGVITLIVLTTAGYELWKYWNKRQSQQSASLFISAIKPDNEKADQQLRQLITDGYKDYKTLAIFKKASDLDQNGKKTEAIAEYNKIIANNNINNLLRDTARIRCAIVQFDQADEKTITSLLAPVANGENKLKFIANELMAFMFYNNGDKQKAAAWFVRNVNPQAMPAISRRAQAMLQLLQGEGISDQQRQKQEDTPTDDTDLSGNKDLSGSEDR